MKTCYYNHHKNKKLYELFEKNIQNFTELANTFSSLYDVYSGIPLSAPEGFYFNNNWFPLTDAISLGIILNKFRDIESVIEVGSGNSTRLFRLLRDKLNSKFKLTSIDPIPRADITEYADKHINTPLEETDIEQLLNEINSKKTLLFIDSSHRVSPSSDCSIIISEIINNLNPGVVVHFHDIFLPDDYPDAWKGRGYNEQYFLANYLLNSEKYNLLWASWYINRNVEIEVLNDFCKGKFTKTQRDGGSLWIEIKEN